MVEFQGRPVARLGVGRAHYDALISHCLRKLAADYVEGETRERKAYGLIGGTLDEGILTVGRIAPLMKNARAVEPYKSYMDELLGRFAIPSETPLDKRAWVADPTESRKILLDFARTGMELIATYHMHRVGWENDPLRDMPTELDTILAEGSEAFLVIVSTVRPESPIVRAFYEGIPEQEVPIFVQ
jgi:hypothetical protein